MKIAIFGTGYVGLVTGVCLANLGHEVTCVDVIDEKIAKLKKGEVPIYEPGLAELMAKNSNRLEFTTNAGTAVKEAEVIFIAVGTPAKPDGSADLKYVYEVARTLSQEMDSSKVIVIKSTVPVGTETEISKLIEEHYHGEYAIVSNPEFLREGSAIDDFMKPDRVIIGTSDQKALDVMLQIYEKLDAPMIHTDIRSAQLIKYASNAFLATKISFVNEMAKLAEKYGANIEYIAKGMGYDKRIGHEFLRAGIGYGGSCFPKDVKELIHTGETVGINLEILKAVDDTNDRQKSVPVKKLKDRIKLSGATVAVLGLAFKPNTDDLREAPSLEIIRELLEAGANVKAWDPAAEEAYKKIYPNIEYSKTPEDTLRGADAVIIATEWDQVKNFDLQQVKQLMNTPLVIDGRNAWDKNTAEEVGLDYQGMGK